MGKLRYILKTMLRKIMPRKECILVYQYGKVASNSICAAVNEILGKNIALHVHLIDKEKRNKHMRVVSYACSVTKNRIQLNTKPHGERYYTNHIITLTRDPVARNVAAYFQNFKLRNADTIPLSDFNSHRENFFADEFEDPLLFFDTIAWKKFGINVYDTPFDYQKGYHIYQNQRCRVLLIRYESIDVFETAIREFFNDPDIQCSLPHKNTAKSKYSEEKLRLYEQFKAMSFPESYLDRYYNSQLLKHFYSADEIQAFRTKWTQG